MHSTKIITTLKFIKNNTTYIGFKIHQIPKYLDRSEFEFNHTGFTFIQKSNLKDYTISTISKR
jgi:hypothetical protein